MKVLLFILLFSLVGFANTKTQIKTDKILHSYNHKPSIKLKQQRELRALAKISKNDAKKITASVCHEKINVLTLTHKKQLLYYRIYTDHCKLEINALDGMIISKVIL
jgi:hypothetical protein